MPIIVNRLETQEEIDNYKTWLMGKSSHYLKCLTLNFDMDMKKDEPTYPNISLRIELLKNEIERRNLTKF